MKKGSYNYFENFKKNIGYSLKCSKNVYKTIVEYGNIDIEYMLAETHKIEHLGDYGKHEMTEYLLKDFLPPIEREDIILLSQKVDDITDLVEEILISIDMYNVTNMREDIVLFAELLVKCCEKEYELFEQFKSFKNYLAAQTIVIEVNEIEEKADKLYTNAMKKLYRDGTKELDIIKWTKIYTCFEECFDTCENVANNVESIILKNL